MRPQASTSAFAASVWPMLVPGLLLMAAGCLSAGEPEETVVPFTICEFSQTWTRPSEEEQAKEVWARSRYGAADVDKLRAQLYEDFFLWHGHR